MRRITAKTLAAAALLAAAAPQVRGQSVQGFNLVPYPDALAVISGTAVVAEGARIEATDATLADLARILSNDIFALSGKRLKPALATGTAAGKGADGSITLRLDGSLAREAYVIDVQDRIEVAGGGYQGLAHGATTLLQLLESNGALLQAPRVHIEDRPESPFRALLIDIARQPHSLEGLKLIITYCRLYKINYLQLHLTDTEAVTFPFTSVTGLVNQNQRGIVAFTKAEWLDLIQFADRRGVTLIPEIEMPGHAGAFVRARPDLFRTGTYHHATLNIANPAAITALKAILTEICEVFKSSPYIHIGADEADLSLLHYGKGDTRVDPAVRAQWDAYMDSLTLVLRKAGRLGATQTITSAEEVYKDFVNLMSAHLRTLGRKTIMWEGFRPGLATGVKVDTSIAIMPFDIFYNPSLYMDAGHKVINASWTPLYIINGAADPAAGIHPSVDSIFAWDKMSFDVYPKRMTPTSRTVVAEKYAPDIIGSMMCVWETKEILDTMYIRQRLPAMAEKVWYRKSGLTYEDFQARLKSNEALVGGLVAAGKLPLPAMDATGLRPGGRGVEAGSAARAYRLSRIGGSLHGRSSGREGSAPGLIRLDGRRWTSPLAPLAPKEKSQPAEKGD